MTLEEATRLLERLERDGSGYVRVNEDATAVLDGTFEADEIEAVAVVLRARTEPQNP